MTFDAFADFRMDGHVALVTGGSQNIGEAIARTFAGAGAQGRPHLLKAQNATVTNSGSMVGVMPSTRC